MDTETARTSRWQALGFTVVGIVLGAGFQYVGNLSLEKTKYLEEAKKDAYVDFLDAQQKYYEAQAMDNKEKAAALMAEHNIQMAAAKKRVAIYGGRNVAEAMAEYYRSFQSTKCPDSTDKDVAIYRSMRVELLPRSELISDADLSMLLFNCRYQK